MAPCRQTEGSEKESRQSVTGVNVLSFLLLQVQSPSKPSPLRHFATLRLLLAPGLWEPGAATGSAERAARRLWTGWKERHLEQ